MYLGPAAWRPFNAKLLDGFNFEKGGGLVGGGVLEWGSHCVDLCQWAVGADPRRRSSTTRRSDRPLVARYAERRGADLPRRPVGFRWVRARCASKARPAGSRRATAARLVLSSPELLAGRKVAEIGGYPATFHVRDFLDCVKTRSQPKGNADAACIRTYRLPRGEHRVVPGSPGEVRLQRRTSLSATNRRIGCVPRRSANRGDFKHER